MDNKDKVWEEVLEKIKENIISASKEEEQEGKNGV